MLDQSIFKNLTEMDIFIKYYWRYFTNLRWRQGFINIS